MPSHRRTWALDPHTARLLTESEYHETGLLHTKEALERLRSDPTFRDWARQHGTVSRIWKWFQRPSFPNQVTARILVTSVGALVLLVCALMLSGKHYIQRKPWSGQEREYSEESRTSECEPCAPCPEDEPACLRTPVSVVETSLGLGGFSQVIRHLGLRAGGEDNFMEAHFGPSGAITVSEGFLAHGRGMVAQSQYLDVFPAGCTRLKPDEVISWCQEWARGRMYLAVGLNCWTMVHEFLSTHEGCCVSDTVRFKEEGINGAMKLVVEAVDELAQENGCEANTILQDLMSEPASVLPKLAATRKVRENLSPYLQGMQAPDVMTNLLSLDGWRGMLYKTPLMYPNDTKD